MNTAHHGLPADHPYRRILNDEVHARPPEPLQAPLRATHLVCYSGAAPGESEHKAISDLADAFGVEPPHPEVIHYRRDLGPVRVKWERHTEFTSYTFFADGVPGSAFDEPAIDLVPEDWLAELPGHILSAAHVAVVTDSKEPPDHDRLSTELFNGNVLIGAAIAGGAGVALTDFRIHDDGFSRFWVAGNRMTPALLGRMLQRMLEIETYRMMALLALPVAQSLSPFLSRCEQELVDITAALADSRDADEPSLLNRLTQVQAEIENRHSDNHYRFAAADAYYALVRRRIVELREERIPGLQNFQEFTERRSAPAMDTCRAVAERQDSLSEGLARATQLLSTRVSMARLEQNQAVLESMNRRAQLQLRLQETVEVLSMGAVTYYIVRLIGYAAGGLGEIGVMLNAELIMACSIPVVATAAILFVRRVRRMVAHEAGTS